MGGAFSLRLVLAFRALALALAQVAALRALALARAARLPLCAHLLDELVVVADRPGRIDAGIDGYGIFEGGVAEQLPEELEGAGIAIENRAWPRYAASDGA